MNYYLLVTFINLYDHLIVYRYLYTPVAFIENLLDILLPLIIIVQLYQ